MVNTYFIMVSFNQCKHFLISENGQPDKNFVARRSNAIFRCGLFTRIVKISRARVPIIKCVHKNTGLACDVTFMTKLGVMNSRLIGFILSLDPKLRHVFMVLKYWARLRDITGIGKFSNYAFSLLGIFYLQQLEPPILPTVKRLQELVKDDEREWSNEWECSFCDDKTKVTYGNNLTMKEILRGFFNFFASYNYTNYVISPLYGVKVDKEFLKPDLDKAKLKEFDGLPESMKLCITKLRSLNDQKKQQDTRFYVQDPFDLHFNVTKAVKENLANKFIFLCNYYSNVVFDINKSDCDIVKLLFSEPTVPIPEDIVSDKRTKMNKNIPMLSNPLPNTSDQFKLTEKYKRNWFHYMKTTILFALESIYKFTIDPRPEVLLANPSKKLLYEDLAFETISCTCVNHSTVYNSRKQVAKKLVLSKNAALSNEIMISDELIWNSKEPRKVCKAQLELVCHPNLPMPQLCVSFVNVTGRKGNSFMPFMKWFEKDIIFHCNLVLKSTFDSHMYVMPDVYKKLKKKHSESTRVVVNKVGTENNHSSMSDATMDSDGGVACGEEDSNFAAHSDVTGLQNAIMYAKLNSDVTPNTNVKRKFNSDSSPEKGVNVRSNAKQKRFKQPQKKYSRDYQEVQSDPGSLLLKAIEKPFCVDGWD